MRFSALVGSAALLGASLVIASDVIDLNGDNFESIVHKESLILVEFFAPWCGHCKALAPHYEEAATALKEKNLKIAKVDCVEQSELCSQHGVTGYPTLKVFRDGEPSDYGGPRKADGIISYMVKQSLPAVSEITAAEHNEFKDSDRVVLIAYLPSLTDAPAPAFSKIADKHRDDYLFGITSDEAAAKAAGVTPPAIVLYKQFDEGRVEFPSKGIKDTNSEQLAKFIGDNSMPLFDEVTGDNYPSYAAAGLPLGYLFLDPAADDNTVHIDALKPIAKKHKGKMNFVWIDGVKYGDHAKTLNLKTETWPAFVIQDLDGGFKYPLAGNNPSFAIVDAFVTKYVDGKLEPVLKSQDVPETQDEPTITVVGSTYDQYVNDLTKDVFMEFYAPWCGHCKRLKPIWDELGENFAHAKDKLIIAKMDATENDLPPNAPFKINGFPTLKFRPAGSADFVDYEGDRSLESLIAFVNKEAKNDLTVTVKDEVTSTQVSPTESAEVHQSHEHVEL